MTWSQVRLHASGDSTQKGSFGKKTSFPEKENGLLFPNTKQGTFQFPLEGRSTKLRGRSTTAKMLFSVSLGSEGSPTCSTCSIFRVSPFFHPKRTVGGFRRKVIHSLNSGLCSPGRTPRLGSRSHHETLGKTLCPARISKSCFSSSAKVCESRVLAILGGAPPKTNMVWCMMLKHAVQ